MKRYRLLLAELDNHGITAAIKRVGPKWYEVHVNYEVKKRYKLRRSANAYIVRLHSSAINADSHGVSIQQ
jgi:hypothetical protein